MYQVYDKRLDFDQVISSVNGDINLTSTANIPCFLQMSPA